MNLLLHLPPELETKLDEQAKATGQTPEEIVVQLLEQQLDGEPRAEGHLSATEWVADIHSWAEGHRRLSHEAEDSRESIYTGRGE